MKALSENGLNTSRRRLFAAGLLAVCIGVPDATIAEDSAAARPVGIEDSSQGLSTVEVPVTLNLGPFYAYLDSRIPWRMDSGQGWKRHGGVKLQYDIWRGPLQASMSGNRLRASIPLGYRVRARKSVAKVFKVDGSCGVDEPPRVVTVRLESQLAWGKDWNLLSRTRVYPNRFANPCLMTFANIDVTPVVDRELGQRLVRIARQTIDRQVPRLTDVEALAAEAWSALQLPLELDDGIWLLVRPESLSLGPLNGHGAALATSVGISARPRIVFGSPPEVETLPLPDLQVARQPRRGFHVEAQTSIRHEELRALLEARLSAVMQRFGGTSVRLDSVEVDAKGDSIQLTIHAASPLPISLRLEGTPVYDRANSEIFLEDVLLENVTVGDATNQVERWVLDGLGDQLERQARWPVSVPFRTALKRLGESLAPELSGGIEIDVRIEDIRIHDARSTPDRLSLTATLEGTARLTIARAPGRRASD